LIYVSASGEHVPFIYVSSAIDEDTLAKYDRYQATSWAATIACASPEARSLDSKRASTSNSIFPGHGGAGPALDDAGAQPVGRGANAARAAIVDCDADR